MNLGSLLQDILSEVSSRIISFQMRLHLLIALIKNSEYFRFIESLRTCIMASHLQNPSLFHHKSDFSPRKLKTLNCSYLNSKQIIPQNHQHRNMDNTEKIEIENQQSQNKSSSSRNHTQQENAEVRQVT